MSTDATPASLLFHEGEVTMAITIEVRRNPTTLSAYLESARTGFVALYASTARYLGIECGDLRERLTGGDSLADLATFEGRSLEGLRAVLLAVLRSTPASAGSDVATFAARLVHGRPGADRVAGAPFGVRPCFASVRTRFDDVERTVAGYLGLDVGKIRELVSAGASLADIAAVRARSVDGLERVVLAALHDLESDPTRLLTELVEEFMWLEGRPGQSHDGPAAA
jgi:hypothetical protein